MFNKEIIAKNRSSLNRDEVRELLVRAWLERPEQERNQRAAERFVAKAAEDFDFESERPRIIEIRSWILPHVIRAKDKPETALSRWLRRPWYKRRQWPLKIAVLLVLAYTVFNIFWALKTGYGAFAVVWVPIAVLAILLLVIVFIPRNSDL